MKKKMAVTLLVLTGTLHARQADMNDIFNRASFRAGYLIGTLATGDFALAINYERFLPWNSSVGASVGHTVVSEHGFNDYSLAEVSFRRFLFGDHQRLAISASVFARYRVSVEKETTIAAPIKIGYVWQWSRLFLSLEAGLGPGFYTNQNTDRYKFQSDIVDAYSNFGFSF